MRDLTNHEINVQNPPPVLFPAADLCNIENAAFTVSKPDSSLDPQAVECAGQGVLGQLVLLEALLLQ